MADGEELGKELLEEGKAIAETGVVPPVVETPSEPAVPSPSPPIISGLEREFRKLISDLHTRVSALEAKASRHPSESNTSIVFDK